VIRGGNGNDLICPDAGDDIVNGGAGNDEIWTDDGNDVANGGGDDLICGENGNDYLVGGTGLDVMTGGNGDDVFGLTKADVIDGSVDVITDFGVGEDLLEFGDLGSLLDDTEKSFRTEDRNGDAVVQVLVEGYYVDVVMFDGVDSSTIHDVSVQLL
jgi:Ca2+-binding RTX toxin-like protein